MRIGLLHPGNMGAALATCVDGETLWASDGRSDSTAVRAREAGIVDVGSLESLVAAADVVISVCPPAVAVVVAEQVNGLGFRGLYADLNAVSPATARRLGRIFGRFVDGGIVGLPPPPRDTGDRARRLPRADGSGSSGTRLYLSGREAPRVAELFAGSPVDARVIGAEPGRASALKMAYAAWTKGTSALLLSVAALAAAEDIAGELLGEWDRSIPGLGSRLERISADVGRKAWRFVGEMEEIARTYGDAGLPGGFHLAAAEVFARLAHLRYERPGLLPDEIARVLLHQSGDR